MAVTLLGSSLLLGCGASDDENPTGEEGGEYSALNLNLNLPDSLTGGEPILLAAQSVSRNASKRVQASKMVNVNGERAQITATAAQTSNQPCSFMGSEDDDFMRNGYEMTKFMVSTVASWSCISDTLVSFSEFVEKNGVITAADNDTASEFYDPEEPTHYSVHSTSIFFSESDSSDVSVDGDVDEGIQSLDQITMKLYYGFDQSTPPTTESTPQFFITWIGDSEEEFTGKIIVDALAINPDLDEEEPIKMRMDFSKSSTQRVTDMFMEFDDEHEFATGFRIKVIKALDVNPLTTVFQAQGIIETKGQWLEVNSDMDNGMAVPEVTLFAVSNQMGEGAAIAQIDSLALPLEISSNNHLGDYLMDKSDIYFFDDDQQSIQPWDWIEKSISESEFLGGRTTPATGGTEIDPSLDMMVSYLDLDLDYFTQGLCENIGDNCDELLNAVFQDGFEGQEQNQGTDPQDWRSEAIENATYLESVYPNGVDWSGAFDLVLD